MEPGREGGMWLGAALKTDRLKFGALLNVTGAPKLTCTKGRGPLVYNYLSSDLDCSAYIDTLGDCYGAYNLFVMEVDRHESRAYHHSNSPQQTIDCSGAQTLAFGNSTPAAPLVKVQRGKERFRKIVDSFKARDDLVDELLQLLKCKDKCLPDEELRRRAPMEYDYLSSCFVEIRQGGYGTRTHSILLVDDEFNVEFIEHTLREPIDVEHPQWEVTNIRCRL